MKHPVLPLSFALLFAATSAHAEDAEVRARIADRLPGVSVADVQPAPVPGLYEVLLGPRVLYVSADARFVVQGSVIDLDSQSNITEPRRSVARARWVDGIDESQMVVFEPRGRTRHTVTVFTDVDCGYCRQMHAEIDELLQAGVRVRYLLYPRNGPGTASARKAEHVWCSDDRHAALTAAKRGEAVTAPPCQTPVMDNLLRGRELPVTGTPSLVTDGGRVIPGYLPPAELVAELERLRAAGAR